MTRRPSARPGLPARLALLALIAGAIVACSGTSGVPTVPPSSAGPSTPVAACPTSEPPALAAGETRAVTIATKLGTIELKIHADWSPIAAGNFVSLAGCGYYDGVGFHRVAALQDGTPFVIQGGDPEGTGTGGPGYTISDEPVTQSYRRGTLAMARTAAPNSQGSQFFIVLSDGAGPILASYNTYAIFGEVTAGMDVADAIFQSADAEMPIHPVVMDDVTVTAP